MEFTQPLGVGLGLAVGINNQYSHPICMGRHTDDYYLLGNVDAGTQEFAGTGNHVNDGQMRQTDESQMMMSHWGHASQLHK